MAGMLQIITYLLCVYLIFKGIEIFQIALMSSRERRAPGLILGVIAIVVAVACATMFMKWIDQQASVMSQSSP